MRRAPSILVTMLATTILLAGCTSNPETQPAEPAAPSDAVTSPSSSSEPSQTPTEEPPELIGGGTELFPDRRFVGLYGYPGDPALGALGEQGPKASAQRAIDLAETYEPYSDEPVYPAFEIIATVASSEPGADGDYSYVTEPEKLEAYVDAAEENDVYVVLDLQPGHSDFLSQAKAYEDLLMRPNVGLALDPEWRLSDGQVHMQQIGSVDAQEVNETTEWLAELTADNDLPQKMLILHQFRQSMIQNRDQLNTEHSELAMVLHADGHGTPNTKMQTWEMVQQDLPDNIYMAWKNFYSQDEPMFSPQETIEVEPHPWFVSYQ